MAGGVLGLVAVIVLIERVGMGDVFSPLSGPRSATVPVPSEGGQRLRSHPSPNFGEQPCEGDVVLSEAEIGMGGPIYSVQMLRDGAIIQSNDRAWRDIAGSSLRLGRLYIGQGTHVVALYDEAGKTLSSWHDTDFGGLSRRLNQILDSGGDIHPVLRCPPLSTVAFKPFRGLWLPPEHYPPHGLPAERLQRRLAGGRELSARLLAPADLRTHSDPERFIYSQPYALALDGIESGRHVSTLDEVHESPDGRWLVVGGVRVAAWGCINAHLWLVHHQGQWMALEQSAAAGRARTYRHYQTRVLGISDSGTLTLQLIARRYASDQDADPIPDTLELEVVVEWLDTDLLVRARKGQFCVQTPHAVQPPG